MRMLVVAAHPDDEVLGCGGTMARFSAIPKNEVFTVIVTEGCSAQYENDEYMQIAEKKKRDSVQAGQILGVRETWFGNYPDMKLDTIAHVKLNKFLEESIRDVKPDILLTHHPGDINMDHQMVYRSAVAASRPVGIYPAAVFLFEVPSSTEWQGYDMGTVFVPNTFVDISTTLSKKIEAMRCYDLELREPPHPRSEYGIKTCAMFRGLAGGLTEAEGFRLFRAIDFGMGL